MLEFNRCRHGQQFRSHLHMPRPVNTGNRDGAVVSGFFIARTQPLTCRGQHGRGEGELLLWGRSERAVRVAKIVPLTERLSGMCGSVQHRRSSSFTREG